MFVNLYARLFPKSATFFCLFTITVIPILLSSSQINSVVRRENKGSTQVDELDERVTNIDTFLPTDLFLYSLKTLKKLCFWMFSGGIERYQWYEIG